MARAPAILLGAWILTVLVSVPLVVAMRGQLLAHLGASLAADSAAQGVNYDWMQEFAGQARGLGETFRPTVIGFGAILDNLSAFVDNGRRPLALVSAAAAYFVMWLFLAGGAIDRFARDRPTRPHGFFMAGGVFLFRFLRLGLLMAVAYGLLFRVLHPWMFETLYSRLTEDVTVERTAFFIRLVLYAAFLALVAACNLVFDFAKVRAVIEDRRSMVGATAAAIRFIGRNGRVAVGLYLANVSLYLLVIAVYAVVAPGARWMTWLMVLLGQLYILARLFVKLVFMASETSLFQDRFAHARFVARSPAAWPDSPSAEALSR